MPRTSTRAFPNSPTAIRKVKDEKTRDLFDNSLRKSGVKKYQLAKKMQMTPQTYVARMKLPKNITLGELRAAREVFGWTAEELAEII